MFDRGFASLFAYSKLIRVCSSAFQLLDIPAWRDHSVLLADPDGEDASDEILQGGINTITHLFKLFPTIDIPKSKCDKMKECT
jgi:hypothetical protein